MTEIEKLLREALSAQGESYETSPDAWARVQERAARPRRAGRRRAVPVLAAAVACTAVAVLLPARLGPEGSDVRAPRTGRPAPPVAASTADAQQAARERELYAVLCRRGTSPREHAMVRARLRTLPLFGGGWLVAVGDGAGGLRLQIGTWQGGRPVCRPFAPDVFRLGEVYVAYAGERGRGEVSWSGLVPERTYSFEAVYQDGTRMRFACDADGERETRCVRSPTTGGRSVLFTTAPRMYRPARPGARVSGMLILRDRGGVLIDRVPFHR